MFVFNINYIHNVFIIYPYNKNYAYFVRYLMKSVSIIIILSAV